MMRLSSAVPSRVQSATVALPISFCQQSVATLPVFSIARDACCKLLVSDLSTASLLSRLSLSAISVQLFCVSRSQALS